MMNTIGAWFFGLCFSVILGNIVTFIVVSCLRKRIGRYKGPDGKPYLRFSTLLGILESILYTISYVGGMHFLIGVWIAVKMAGRWSSRENLVIDKSNVPPESINIFLIGNLLILLFGIIGGVIIKHFLT